MPAWLAQHLAALRALLVLTLVLGAAYPLAVTVVARLPGLRGPAQGSLVRLDDRAGGTAGGRVVGSALVGQSFTDADGAALPRYFQSRPSAAGDGYDPTASGASNLGPESVVDTPDAPSLLTRVCARSRAVGRLEGVDGRRPYCTGDGVGAVLAVFRAGGLSGAVTRVVAVNQTCPATPFLRSYQGVPVECVTKGADDTEGVITPVRGDAPAHPAVPPDAVTAGGSGLDPQISPAYAAIQVRRVATARGLAPADVRALVEAHTHGRVLGFLGARRVDVLALNLALDQRG